MLHRPRLTHLKVKVGKLKVWLDYFESNLYISTNNPAFEPSYASGLNPKPIIGAKGESRTMRYDEQTLKVS